MSRDEMKSSKYSEVEVDLTQTDYDIMTNEARLKVIVNAHTLMVKVTSVFALVTLLSVILLTVVFLRDKPVNHYFATTSDGRIIKLASLDEPMLSVNTVESFAGRAISNTFTLDYANYHRQIASSADNYTPEAFTEIQKSLEKHNGIATEAIRHNWVVTANVMAAPTVVRQGRMPGGTYGWQLRYTIQITFQSEERAHSSRYDVDVTVIRVSQKDNPRGVAISKLNLTPYRTSHE